MEYGIQVEHNQEVVHEGVLQTGMVKVSVQGWSITDAYFHQRDAAARFIRLIRRNK
jgi:hypothetical protein